MKKTLVAIAAIVATTGAMAEAVISGGVDYGFHRKVTDGTTTLNFMGGDTNQFNNLAFSASEDLGNGMTAKAKIDLGIGYSEGAGVSYTRESWVGLSGPFGDVSVGRQYTPIFLAATIDPLGLPALSIGQEGLNTIFLTGTGDVTYVAPDTTSADATLYAGTARGGRDVRANSSLSYTSPSFGGVKVNVFSAMSGVQNSATVGYTSGYGVSYALDALSVNYQRQTADLEGIAAVHTDAAAGTNDVFTAGTGDTTRSLLAASYDLGFAKLAYINGTAENSALKIATNYFAVGVPITGTNLSIAAGVTTSTVSDLADATQDATMTGSLVKVNYAFSKRTNVYMLYGQDKTNNQDGADLSRTTISTSFGLSHTF